MLKIIIVYSHGRLGYAQSYKDIFHLLLFQKICLLKEQQTN